MSVTAFAARSDLDRVYLGRLERGMQNPTLLVLARIAVELGMQPEELLAGIVVDPDEVREVKRLTRGPSAAKDQAAAAVETDIAEP